jgi:hypothetical protein
MLAAALSRRWWIAGVLTLALAAASSDVALGMPTYSVNVSVPTTAQQGQKVDIKVHGHAGDRVSLSVYTSTAACRDKVFDEAKIVHFGGTHHKLTAEVDGSFSTGFRVEGAKGTHYACAYLYKSSFKTLAHGAASWQVG